MAWSSREVVSQLQLLCCPEVLGLDWDTLGDRLKGMDCGLGSEQSTDEFRRVKWLQAHRLE